MRKNVIIEDPSNKKIKNMTDRFIKNRFVEWLLYMLGYSIVLITMSVLFKSLDISSEYYGLYAFLGAVIIYFLNQTIKPVIFIITLPLTGLTLGLFYPLINVLILYITSWILGDKFVVHGLFIPFIIAMLISTMNFLMEGIIIKPIVEKSKKL